MTTNAAEVREGWTMKQWGDLATLEYGKGLRGHEDSTGDFRVYGTNGPIGWTSSPLCPFPTVVVGRKGAYRGIHFSPAPCFVIDTAFYLKPKRAFDMRWAYYQLLTQDINGLDSGSAIPSTTRDAFYRIPVLEPPIEEQRRIASVLGSLDDRIELNRQICETLEEMARAIFRSWFVDFDPVRAKIAAIAEGRDPERAAMATISGKSEADLDSFPAETLSSLRATAARFPDALVDSELGERPEGWCLSHFGDVAAIQRGVSYKSSELAPSTVALVTLKSFSRGGGYREDGLKEYTGACKPEQEVHPGDLIIAHTDVTLAAEVIGRPALVSSSAGYERLIISLDVGVVRPIRASYKQFLYGLASTQAFTDHMLSYTSGTTVLHLSSKAVPSFRFADPGEEIVSGFNGLAAPMFAQVQLLLEQCRTLASIRDALLPKLLSGETGVLTQIAANLDVPHG